MILWPGCVFFVSSVFIGQSLDWSNQIQASSKPFSAHVVPIGYAKGRGAALTYVASKY